jgi:hypothetical protein
VKIAVKILLVDIAGDVLICKKKDGKYWESAIYGCYAFT